MRFLEASTDIFPSARRTAFYNDAVSSIQEPELPDTLDELHKKLDELRKTRPDIANFIERSEMEETSFIGKLKVLERGLVIAALSARVSDSHERAPIPLLPSVSSNDIRQNGRARVSRHAANADRDPHRARRLRVAG
jgi:hypothetical protein